jgi:alkanesulfonate monooxygenase SsuD/methylene tetrahydromethanopterin reductase-like flavin-dependent oxidoreductase (luciferase family)
MQVDVLLDPFGGRWSDMKAGAEAVAEAGFDGIWIYDHLAGSVHRASRVLECWTTLTAIAATVPAISVGPMVLNVANRDPGTLAVMAATLQEVSGGRLLLGVGAGGGPVTPYAAEQRALGRTVGGDTARRLAVEETIAHLREVWSGAVGGASGFPKPEPPPPIVVGAFGPKMAALAGRRADGINVPAGSLARLVAVAREARARAGLDPAEFLVTASTGPSPREHSRLEAMGVDRAVVFVGPPYVDGVRRARAALAP